MVMDPKIWFSDDGGHSNLHPPPLLHYAEVSLSYYAVFFILPDYESQMSSHVVEGRPGRRNHLAGKMDQ